MIFALILIFILVGALILLARDLLKEKVKNYKLEEDFWISPEALKPEDKEHILCYYWYDGPHYFTGYYIKKTQEIEFYAEDDFSKKERCPIETIWEWAHLPEPNHKN